MDLNFVSLVDSCLLSVDSCLLSVDSLKLFELWVAGLLSFIHLADVVRPRQHQFITNIKRDRF